jgi:hypothetical protein
MEEHPGVRQMMDLVGNPAFGQAVADLGGYDVTEAGRIRRIS